MHATSILSMKYILLVKLWNTSNSQREIREKIKIYNILSKIFILAFNLHIIIYVFRLDDKYDLVSATEILLRRSMQAKEQVDSFMAKGEDTPSSPLME